MAYLPLTAREHRARAAADGAEDGYDSGPDGAVAAASDSGEVVDTQRLFQKIGYRLLPLFFTMVVCCYVDRTSLAFAAIQMNDDLQFSPTVYGMGSGLFFLGYSLFQIPSNLLLKHFGGPAWLAVIIAAWGVVAAAFAGMSTVAHFYTLRLLLGVAESGAFPGMWYVLTMFFPGDQATFPFAVVESGISLSHVLAAPLAAACLSLDGLGGIAGWRWLFVVEGLPTIGLAVLMYRTLPRSPETATFLTPAERRALIKRIELHARTGGGGAAAGGSAAAGGKRGKARPGGAANGHHLGAGGGAASHGAGVVGDGSNWVALRAALTNKWVWYMGAVKFVRDVASFGLIFWTPTIVNSLLEDMRHPHGVAADSGAGARGRSLLGAVLMPHGHGHAANTGMAAVLLTALPFALAAAAGMVLAHSVQRTGERFLHISLPYIVTGCALSTYSSAADYSPWLGFAMLSMGVMGVYMGSGPCISLVSELAAGPGLVVALPLYNSLGTLGGFVGPALVGWLVQRARRDSSSGGGVAAIVGGGFGVSAKVLGGALALAGLLVLALGVVLGQVGHWGPWGWCARHGPTAVAAAVEDVELLAPGGDSDAEGGGAGRTPKADRALRV